MKVVLSRKGFDSKNGRIPSAIMPNGDVLSFPIPSDDAAIFDELAYDGVSYGTILNDLFAQTLGFKGCPFEHCHVDPDLDRSRWQSPPKKWGPAFGPSYDIWHYLNEVVGVQEGDLFLFFGTFHFVTRNDTGKFEFSSKTGDFYRDCDLHLIWGYMQIGEIILDRERIIREYPWHPHVGGAVLLVPRKRLSFNPSMPGSGLLPFAKKRVLTRKGKSKAYWQYNAAYAPENIVVAKGRKNSSRDPDCIYYSGIWQELGLKEGKTAENWCKRMILE